MSDFGWSGEMSWRRDVEAAKCRILAEAAKCRILAGAAKCRGGEMWARRRRTVGAETFFPSVKTECNFAYR